MLVFLSIAIIATTNALITNRIPEWETGPQANCRVNLCSGPRNRYPANTNMNFYAEYTVPPLPAEHTAQQTYYIYYNIFFGDGYGKFNQFVPQLMLGSALTNSTNAPNYKPIFTTLNSWYIGSQYFFALYNESASNGWTGKAATGDLIDVYDGDIVYTSFKLNDDGVWSLIMGIKGNDTAISIVNATEPYMGLLSNVTKSWNEDTYNKTTIGCCWELYSINNGKEYPPFMDYQIITTSQTNGSSFFSDWTMHESPNCSYSPDYSLDTGVNSPDDTQQITFFDIFYD